jgi:hypothetical protein
MTLLHACDWLAATRWSTSLRESTYAYPAVESVHVLTLCLFLGLTIAMDLRLTGVAFRRLPAREMVARLQPWIRPGFAVMALTGSLLFLANPTTTITHRAFQVKLVLLTIAGLNAAIFPRGVYRSPAHWATAAGPPLAARIAGGVSLAAWTGVVAAGRLIAYEFLRPVS